MKTISRRVLTGAIAISAALTLAFGATSSAADQEIRKPNIVKPDNAARIAAIGDATFLALRPKHTENQGISRCVDISGASSDAGAQAILWDCHGGANQQWSYLLTLSDDINDNKVYLNFANQISGKCVDLFQNSPENGARVIQWLCHNGANQQWEPIFNVNDPNDPWFQLKNRKSGKCLDVALGSTANGAEFVQWDCHGGDNQKLRFAAF